MPTRFYLPSVGPSAVTPPSLPAGWTLGTVEPLTAPVVLEPTDTPLTQFPVPETINTVTNIPVGIFVSEPLGAQTLSGTITAVVKGYATTGTAADDALQIGVYVISGDGTSVVGTAYPGHTAALQSVNTPDVLGQEFMSGGAGAPGSTRIIPAQDLTDVEVSYGQRLMVIVGYRTYDVSATARTSELQFGDPPGGDLPLSSGVTSVLAPWVEFSADVLFNGGEGTIVEADHASTWAVATRVWADHGSTWPVRALVSTDSASTWRVATRVTVDHHSSWVGRTRVVADHGSTWLVEGAPVVETVSADHESSWRVRTRVVADHSSSWRTRTRVLLDLESTWSVRTRVFADHGSTWLVPTQVVVDRASRWIVAGVVREPDVWASLDHGYVVATLDDGFSVLVDLDHMGGSTDL